MAHIAVKQAATLQWWQEIAPKCEIFVSQYVGSEARGGNPEDAERRVSGLHGIAAVDGMIPDVVKLANRLMAEHAVPDTEATDAAHIATASVYGMDVLLTWNCRHMANPVTLPKTAAIVAKCGYQCPVVITPADFVDRKGEFSL